MRNILLFLTGVMALSALVIMFQGCAETVNITYRDGSQETYQHVTDFHCYPNGCASGTARSIGFCIGMECLLITDFTYAEHFWYDRCTGSEPVACSVNWYPYQGNGE
jgi:hypothetical protein